MVSVFQRLEGGSARYRYTALIDHDDPELIEYGDEDMHERLTSQVAEFLKKPNDLVAYALSEHVHDVVLRIPPGHGSVAGKQKG